MRSHLSKATCAVLFAVALTATPALAQNSGETEIRRGVIEQITNTQINSNHHPGVGAIVGGVVGLGLGSLIGGGTGRDVAMVAGTIGGAVAGNEVQKRNEKPVQAQQVMVRVKSGVLVAVTQPVDARLQTGQRVYIEGNGEGARVVPQ